MVKVSLLDSGNFDKKSAAKGRPFLLRGLWRLSLLLVLQDSNITKFLGAP